MMVIALNGYRKSFASTILVLQKDIEYHKNAYDITIGLKLFDYVNNVAHPLEVI